MTSAIGVFNCLMERGRLNGLSPINFEPHCCHLFRHAGHDNLLVGAWSSRSGTVVASSFGGPTCSTGQAKARAETCTQACCEDSAKARFQTEPLLEVEARESPSSTGPNAGRVTIQAGSETQTGTGGDVEFRSLPTQLNAICRQSKPDS